MSDRKYRSWVFTYNSKEGDLPSPDELISVLKKFCDSWVFQLERGEETQREHYQGCFYTKIRVRHSTALNHFKKSDCELIKLTVDQLTIDRMMGSWAEAKDYCTKDETRVAGPYCSMNEQTYTGSDLKILSDRKNFFKWQNFMYNILIEESTGEVKKASDREVVWVRDDIGNNGKSKFVKYLCYNHEGIVKLPFGTASQLRSSVIAAGPQKLIIVDIPRTTGDDDSINSIISVIEDIKNGFIVSSMYGKYEQIMYEPPHVWIFSNGKAPVQKMSSDRWRLLNISDKDIIELNRWGDFYDVLN